VQKARGFLSVCASLCHSLAIVQDFSQLASNQVRAYLLDSK